MSKKQVIQSVFGVFAFKNVQILLQKFRPWSDRNSVRGTRQNPSVLLQKFGHSYCLNGGWVKWLDVKKACHAKRFGSIVIKKCADVIPKMSSGIYIEIGPWNSPKSVRGIPPNPSVVLPKIRPAFTSKWVRDDTQNRTIRWHQNVAGIVFDFFMKCARNKIATTTPPPPSPRPL